MRENISEEKEGVGKKGKGGRQNKQEYNTRHREGGKLIKRKEKEGMERFK